MSLSLFNQDTDLKKGPSPFPLPQEREFLAPCQTPLLFRRTPPLPGKSALFSLSWGRGKGEGPLPCHGGGTEQRSETGPGTTGRNGWISDVQNAATGVVSRARQSTRVRIHPRILLRRWRYRTTEYTEHLEQRIRKPIPPRILPSGGKAPLPACGVGWGGVMIHFPGTLLDSSACIGFAARTGKPNGSQVHQV